MHYFAQRLADLYSAEPREKAQAAQPSTSSSAEVVPVDVVFDDDFRFYLDDVVMAALKQGDLPWSLPWTPMADGNRCRITFLSRSPDVLQPGITLLLEAGAPPQWSRVRSGLQPLREITPDLLRHVAPLEVLVLGAVRARVCKIAALE